MLYNVIVFWDKLKIQVLNMAHRISQVITASLQRGIEFVSEI